ncbi:DUF1963 domain-containing protein [Hymenobacter translucens]|uniref:DUF1963 domain-containing protein n=1 Tax=Hymenobacter translucens TaxID=2886507 RepID=UPI001D0EA425|nr:DUF1963 domain-containing protein [Hymenobacter translucens]
MFNLFGKSRPILDQEKITSRAFVQVQELIKPASIAQLSETKPSGRATASRFSGDFVLVPEQAWPSYQNRPLQAFLQINVAELPFVPVPLRPYKLITVFIDEQDIPFDKPHGQGWQVNCYTSLEGLKLAENPISSPSIKPCEISWQLAQDEAPAWEDAITAVDLSEFDTLSNAGDVFYERFTNHEFTKVGGWPSLIQHQLTMSPADFVLQIGSEVKANWQWVDAGTVYLGWHGGKWLLECQCY